MLDSAQSIEQLNQSNRFTVLSIAFLWVQKKAVMKLALVFMLLTVALLHHSTEAWSSSKAEVELEEALDEMHEKRGADEVDAETADDAAKQDAKAMSAQQEGGAQMTSPARNLRSLFVCTNNSATILRVLKESDIFKN